MNFDTFLKGIAYAYLYKAGGRDGRHIPLKDITLSFIRERTPHKLLKSLKADHFFVEEKFKGIYYIYKEGVIPIQIVGSKKLDKKNPIPVNPPQND